MDFRAFVDLLDSEDEVLWIKQEIDPTYEMAALLQQAESRRKAIWFERVRGADFPAVGAVMSSPERHALSLGYPASQFRKPGGWSDLLNSARARPLSAEIASNGSAAEVIRTGAEADLRKLPVPRFFSGDSHSFLTAGIGISKDPESGVQNAGFYRAPLIDANTFSVSAGGTSRLSNIYASARQTDKKLPVAYVVGAPPALLITAGCRIGLDENDLDIAGALQGTPLQLMRCQTSDLLVPAGAEFIIEAEVDFSTEVEHKMGEFPDQYGITRSPVARITAITHRSDAVFHTILGGMNREHNSLGAYIFAGMREYVLAELAKKYTGIADLHVDLTPRRSGGRCQIAIALEDAATGNIDPNELVKDLYALKFDSFPLMAVVQRVVVVNRDVDIRSSNDIEWAIAIRANSKSRIEVLESPGRDGNSIVRLGINATLSPAAAETGVRPEIPDADRYPLSKYL